MQPTTLKRQHDEDQLEQSDTQKKVKRTSTSQITTLKRSREVFLELIEPVTKKQALNNSTAVTSTIDTEIEELTLRIARLSIADSPLEALVSRLWNSNEVWLLYSGNEVELCFSEILKRTLTDAQLKAILEISTEAYIKSITYFNVSQYPHLTYSAAEYLLKCCPSLQRKSFQHVDNEKFYDIIIVSGEKELPVNRYLIAHFSSFLESPLAPVSGGRYCVPDYSFATLQSCMNILTGSDELKNEKNASNKVALLSLLISLECITILEENEHTLIDFIGQLTKRKSKSALKYLLEHISTYLPASFAAGRLSHLRRCVYQQFLPREGVYDIA
ncbi:MAG: hypothetical protein JSR46_02655 [Verrucomicrobia bacterium]|nr:hypothetical protein [Verrucomicrobiota bacterium]